MEVHSGVLADRHSRRNLLLLAQILRAVGYLLWLLVPNFWGFMIGFVLWGVKSALTSGTFEALVYDDLKQQNKKDRYARTIGFCEGIGLFAVVAAELSASFLGYNGYTLILILSIASLLLSGLSILLLPNAKRSDSTDEINYLAHLKAGIGLVKDSPLVMKLVLFFRIRTIGWSN